MQRIFSFQFKILPGLQAPHMLIVCKFFGSAMLENFSFDQHIPEVADGGEARTFPKF